MTIKLMQQYVESEVENLHIRIDKLAGYINKIDQRLERVENQLVLTLNWIDDLKVRVASIEENMVTKEDLANFITKDDLKAFGEDLKQALA